VNLAFEDFDASIVADRVPPARQTMSLEKIFWSHFCTNLAPVTWVLGALLVGIGLDFKTGLLALAIGNVLGGLPVGLNATIGPHRPHADRDLAFRVRQRRNARSGYD
jgi:NCS1 family nucleobase:cation symporter-1